MGTTLTFLPVKCVHVIRASGLSALSKCPPLVASRLLGGEVPQGAEVQSNALLSDIPFQLSFLFIRLFVS